jgi:hypothetical protein
MASERRRTETHGQIAKVRPAHATRFIDDHSIHTAAARDGHSRETLRRAKRLLALHSHKPARESPWQWSLPEAGA